jgi:hypothetical protein
MATFTPASGFAPEAFDSEVAEREIVPRRATVGDRENAASLPEA